MARIEWMENRLRNWARWCLSQGAGVLGYSRVEPSEVMPGGSSEPYASGPVPTDDIEASETEDLVRRLPVDLERTVRVWYVKARGPAQALQQLGCAEQTARDRIHQAQRVMAAWLTERQERGRMERERVRGLTDAAKPGAREAFTERG